MSFHSDRMTTFYISELNVAKTTRKPAKTVVSIYYGENDGCVCQVMLVDYLLHVSILFVVCVPCRLPHFCKSSHPWTVNISRTVT